MKVDIKKRKLSKKGKKIILSLFIILFVGVIGISYAFYSSFKEVENIFKTAAYDVAIEEEFYDDWGTKKVSIVNKDANSTPVIIRINYDEIWSKNIDGTVVNLSNIVKTETETLRAVTLKTPSDFEANFIDGKDGWYYYTKVLKPNQSVMLLESVALNEDVIKQSPYYEDYKSFDYQLSYNFEAIQATETAVKEIWGLEINVSSDGEITWPF